MKSGFEGIHRQVQKHREATRVEKLSLNRFGVYSAVRSLRDVFPTTLNRPMHPLTTAPQFSMLQLLMVPDIDWFFGSRQVLSERCSKGRAHQKPA